MNTASSEHFDRQYQRHLKHLKLKGLQPKTIEAYSRAIRRIGKRFECRIDDLTEPQLTDHFTELMASHSWSAVKLDLCAGQWGQRRIVLPAIITATPPAQAALRRR